MGLRDQWYENAVIYCLDVETYADSDGDGVGDFTGLTKRLDYIAGLGVTCIWLMPFYPTPGCDDGYDVADYAAIDPRFGTMADFTEFIVEAEERGLHIVADLVPNHTSIDHPWFQAARSDPESPYRDYYVWRHDAPGDTSDQVVFPGKQEGIWTWDDTAGAYYLHHFMDFQPDLNFSNPAVQEEFRKIIGLWLELGVDGFRVDAAAFLINLTGIDRSPDDGMTVAHDFLKKLRDFVTVRKGNAILLGEVDEGLSTIADYFGGGNELHALFNFPLNRNIFLALAQGSADALGFRLQQLPTIPEGGQWVNFLRHHDELNLALMTEEQRQQVFEAFGPDPDMQIFGRGLRRRLAPMLGGDLPRLKLAYNLLFSLPGAPMVFYGEEIGMGEQLSLEGRMAVRTPMQWSAGKNAGFSSADSDQLVRPLVDEGEFGYEHVNVSEQRGKPDSLLNWMASLIRTRKECGEIGTGAWQGLNCSNDAVFGIRYDTDDASIVVVNNLSGNAQTITVDLGDRGSTVVTDLFGDRTYSPVGNAKPQMRLDPYGYRWIRLAGVY